MNLAIVIPFLEKYGGAERYLIECVRIWQSRHEITIYAVKISEKFLTEHGVGRSVKRCELSPYFTGEHSFVLNAILLPKIWRKEIGQHDLYHTHLWPTHLIDLHPMVWYPHEPLRVLHDLRFSQEIPKMGNNPVRNIHIYPKYNYDRVGNVHFESYLDAIDSMDKSENPERIIANSRYTAGYLEEVYGVSVNDIVYPGVEPSDLTDLPRDRNLFVTISQLWPHKRVNLLVEAISQLDDAQLIVIGSGPDMERLQEIATKLGVGDRVSFLSGLSNHELRMVLTRACAFLFAPIKEPFGIVVLEAMAAGLPVIAVNEGGYVEVCKPEYSFLGAPYPSFFTEKIRYLQRNPQVGRQMGEAAWKAVQEFTWKRAAEETEAVILKVWQKTIESKVKRMTDNLQTQFGIQYYLWFCEGFGNPHWNDNLESGHVSDIPLIGYYGSAKGYTIDNHLELFERMNLDYLILNLHLDYNGANGVEMMGIQHVFDILKKRNSTLKLAIQIVPYGDDMVELEKVIRMVDNLYANQPCYLKLDNSPVLFWFWSSAYDGRKNFIAGLARAAEQFTNIAVSLRLPSESNEDKLTFGFFDGFVPFSPLELAEEKNWSRVWKTAYSSAENSGMRYRIASLSPGYDDSGLTAANRVGNPYRFVSRKAGATYEAGMEFIETLNVKPDLVIISTFNEFHENTHIEPSKQNGMLYIDLTTQFVKRMKQKWCQS